jgi:molybdopterin converting factor small subunit
VDHAPDDPAGGEPVSAGVVATVEVRLFAGARAAAGGLTSVTTAAASLTDVRARLSRDHGEPMARVLRACSFLVDGVEVGRGEDRSLRGARTVDVLPPFAGG